MSANAKISLCMICGNEAGIIEACLDSAADAFDELCLVRAVGDQTPDNTLERAADWCFKHGKEFRQAVYQNAQAMPHVDHFGAARNRSFALATHEWILWLDCDDYLTEINCRRIREAITQTDANAIFATYKVEKNGAEILRERLIRNGAGRWKNAIHETCVVTGEAVNCPQIEIFHRDHTRKNKTSADRNARILRAVLEDAPRHYFYLQAELKMLGDKPGALNAARAAIALLPEDRKEERYHTLLNLSELDRANAVPWLLQAISLQPHRREAFGYLAQEALQAGDTSAAVSWFRAMDALPLPSPLPWTHQGIWYAGQWGRNLLRVKILKACGNDQLAEEEHQKNLSDPDYAENAAKQLA